MCKFCKVIEAQRQSHHAHFPQGTARYSVALMSLVSVKAEDHTNIYTMKDDCLGDGYTLNFCPECGRKLTKNSVIDYQAERQ